MRKINSIFFMKNIGITIALSLLLLGCGQSHDTLNINGVKYTVEGSLEKGLGKCFYENGNIKSTVEITNGALNGKYVEYYEDFKIKKECTYKNGLTNGPLRMYFNNGRTYRQAFYKDGYADGSFTEYNPDGSKTIEISYNNGEMISLTEYKRGNVLKYHLDVKVESNRFTGKTTYNFKVIPEPKMSKFYIKDGSELFSVPGNSYSTNQVKSGPITFIAKGISQYDVAFQLTAKR
jgi:major membrane immunogen (membrane-anchored lipoprotein)